MGNNSVKRLSYRLLNSEEVAIELEELPHATKSRPDNQDLIRYIDKLILSGKALKSLQVMEQFLPELVARDPELHLAILTLEFLELVRKNEPLEALEFAKTQLAEYKNKSVMLRKPGKGEDLQLSVLEVLGVLCYNQPLESDLGYLLDSTQRQKVSDTFNLKAGYINTSRSYLCSLTRILCCLKKKKKFK